MAVKKRFPYQAALVACNGGRATADCEYGCVACGLCVGVCKFDAIEINDLGVAQVNEDKCIACGACVRECPRELIHIHECANPIVVKCSNKDLGKNARKYCEVSCIGCGLCTTKCKFDAIHLKKVRDWHAGSYETMPIKVAEGVVKRAGSIVKKAVSK